MSDTKLGNFEAVALIFTITINHAILLLPKTIINSTGSASLLNIIYVGIIAVLLTLLICKLFSKFPGLDILDISEYLGGRILKTIIGILFFVYFIFVSSVLLKTFANGLQVLYYPATDILFIIALFILAISFVCNLKYNAISKANLILTPIVMISILFLFAADSKYFQFENIFPILGNGFQTTFLTGTSNVFAFSGLACLYLLPSTLKNTKKFKKIALISTFLSLFYLLINIAIILFMFNASTLSNELLPLYSAVRYIEFGTFFQRLDSIFILIWTLSLACYLGMVTHLALSIFKKITNIQDTRPVIYPFVLVILGICLIQKTEYISNFLESTVYKYVFLILTIAIALPIMIIANFKKRKAG